MCTCMCNGAQRMYVWYFSILAFILKAVWSGITIWAKYNSQHAINYIYGYSVVLANEANFKIITLYTTVNLYIMTHRDKKVFDAPLKLNAINYDDCTYNQTSNLKF